MSQVALTIVKDSIYEAQVLPYNKDTKGIILHVWDTRAFNKEKVPVEQVVSYYYNKNKHSIHSMLIEDIGDTSAMDIIMLNYSVSQLGRYKPIRPKQGRRIAVANVAALPTKELSVGSVDNRAFIFEAAYEYNIEDEVIAEGMFIEDAVIGKCEDNIIKLCEQMNKCLDTNLTITLGQIYQDNFVGHHYFLYDETTGKYFDMLQLADNYSFIPLHQWKLDEYQKEYNNTNVICSYLTEDNKQLMLDVYDTLVDTYQLSSKEEMLKRFDELSLCEKYQPCLGTTIKLKK